MSEARESDLTLLDAWRAGDKAAGDRLFVRHFAAVDRFFRNKVGADSIQDLIQRTFMVCVERPDNFHRGSSFRTYLLGIAHNILREYYRAKSKHRHQDIDEVAVVDLGAGPSTLLGAREESAFPRKMHITLEGLSASRKFQNGLLRSAGEPLPAHLCRPHPPPKPELRKSQKKKRGSEWIAAPPRGVSSCPWERS